MTGRVGEEPSNVTDLSKSLAARLIAGVVAAVLSWCVARGQAEEPAAGVDAAAAVTAEGLLRPQAEAGDVRAMRELGLLHAVPGTPRFDPAAAEAWLRRAVAAGSRGAMFDLVQLSENSFGNLTPLDAVALLKPEAEAGDGEAMVRMGALLYNGSGLLIAQPEEAVTWFDRAARQGETLALFNLGVALHEGKGRPVDREKADAFLALAAEFGVARAEVLLAYRKAEPKESPVPVRKVLGWLQERALAGNAGAQYLEGRLRESGEWLSEDAGEARRLYREAAERGDNRARTQLGVMLFEGRGGPADAVGAEDLFRKAAEAGEAVAQLNLGLMLLREDAVAAGDREAGVRWLERAARGGNDQARFELGLQYYDGKVVKQDKARAIRLLEEAARNGHVLAQANLGVFAYEGAVNGKADHVTAAKWWLLAASSGVDVALRYLKRIEPVLTAEEREKAESEAKAFRIELAERLLGRLPKV